VTSHVIVDSILCLSAYWKATETLVRDPFSRGIDRSNAGRCVHVKCIRENFRSLAAAAIEIDLCGLALSRAIDIPRALDASSF
jgi:hypothetical protein